MNNRSIQKHERSNHFLFSKWYFLPAVLWILTMQTMHPVWGGEEWEGLIDPMRPPHLAQSSGQKNDAAQHTGGQELAAQDMFSESGNPPRVAPQNLAPLVIESILYSKDRRIAVVNQQLVKEGSTIAGYQVTAIYPNKVIFRSAGEQREERLVFAVEKGLLKEANS